MAKFGLITLAAALIVCLSSPWAAGQKSPSQESIPDSIRGQWQLNATGSLSGSQAGYRNWQEGGVNTVSFSTSLSGAAERYGQWWHQQYQSRLNFGMSKLNGRTFRKASDLISLNATINYLGSGFFQTFNPTASSSFRTQFAPGFNYDTNPFEQTKPLPVKVSDFLSPGVFTQSLGLTYTALPRFTQQLSLTTKQTIVDIPRLRPLYGVPTEQPVLWEAGMQLQVDFERTIAGQVQLSSSLQLFQAFNSTDLPDMLWENVLTVASAGPLQTNLEATFLYDADRSNNLQIKEVLSLGIAFTLL